MINFEKQAKKLNKKGYPEIYKKLTQQVFDFINVDLMDFPIEGNKGNVLYSTVTFTNIKYSNDYLNGDNSVVDFKITECPDWKFRFCWVPKKNEDKKDKRLFFECKFFCCYIPIEDKFNYYNSEIKCKFKAVQNQKKNLNDWLTYTAEARDIIEFIIKEPYLAFCRDYYGWDYNRQFHDRRSAKRRFEKWKEHYELDQRITTECNEKLLNYVKENILPIYGPNAIIVDRGSNWSPRYEMACKSSEFTPEPEIEPGCYSLAKGYKEEYEALGKFEDSLLKYAEDQRVVWYPYSVIDLSITIIADKKWDDYLKFIEKEKDGN